MFLVIPRVELISRKLPNLHGRYQIDIYQSTLYEYTVRVPPGDDGPISMVGRVQRKLDCLEEVGLCGAGQAPCASQGKR